MTKGLFKTGDIFVFDTHGITTEYSKYAGMTGTIIRQLTELEADIHDVGMMYLVKLENGVEIHAFEDEIVLDN